MLTNDNKFRIYGAQNGMSATEGTVSPTGRAQGEDTATTLTLTGEEDLPYRLLLSESIYAYDAGLNRGISILTDFNL